MRMGCFFLGLMAVCFAPLISFPGFIWLLGLVWGNSCYRCAFTWFTRYPQCSADLVGALFHADQSDAFILHSTDNETDAVIAQLQVNCLRIKIKPGVKARGVSVLQRICQRFLSNVEQIFLDGRCKFTRGSACLKFRPQRSPRSRVFYDRLKRVGKSSFLQRLRPQRVY